MRRNDDSFPWPNEEAKKATLPEIEDATKLLAEKLQRPNELVEGLLHHGSKMVLGGSSKTNKTWTLMDLAISIATGIPWWERKTVQARVLYLNFEIHRAFFADRIRAIRDARGAPLEEQYLDIWNLRGYAADLSSLSEQIISKAQTRYGLIVVDPIYKCLGNRDENKAGDITALMNELERIAVKTNAAIAFGAHFSKGNQASKNPMDRIGGSGVFGRDPDTIITLTQHKVEDVYAVESIVRNLKPVAPFCVKWEHPLMKLDSNFNPEDIKRPAKNGTNVPKAHQVLELFPEKWGDDPRSALLSAKDLEDLLKSHGFNKNVAAAMREELAREGEIKVIRGLPRNQILAGRPAAVKAYLAQESAFNAGGNAKRNKSPKTQSPGAQN